LAIPHSAAVRTSIRRARNAMASAFPWHPHPDRAEFGSFWTARLRLPLNLVGEVAFCYIGFDLSALLVVSQGA